MRKAVGIAVCVGLVWSLLPQDVGARASRVRQLPNGAKFGCAHCHTSASGGGALNAFGNAVPLNGSGASASVNWNATFAAADSDGDGFSNGTELGDPDGDGNPMAGAQVTNPGDATSFPQVINNAPTLATIGAQVVLEGEVLSFALSGSDQDNDTLTLSATGLPDGSAFENGTFTWTPGFDLGGTSVMVTFTVSDGTDDASEVVEIAITDVNRPAAFDSIDPPRNRLVAMEGTVVTFTVDAQDPDGDTVSYVWLVNGTADVESSGTLVLTVPLGSQNETVVVTAMSADGTSVMQTWTIAKMLVGDFDGSGDVGFSDFLAFVAQFGKTSSDSDFDATFDLDGDGAVGFTDFLTFVEFFGLTS